MRSTPDTSLEGATSKAVARLRGLLGGMTAALIARNHRDYAQLKEFGAHAGQPGNRQGVQ